MEHLVLLVPVLAIALDMAFGDPPNRYHPTAWTGRLMAALTGAVAGRGRPWGVPIVAVPAALAVALLWLAGAAFDIAAPHLGYWAAVPSVIFGAVLLKSAVAARGLQAHARAVQSRVVSGDMDSARACLAMIVKRQTAGLGRRHVISGVLESLSENITDGMSGPLFYYGLFGLPGAMIHRIVNTADSMVGYNSHIFKRLGWFAARSDTVLNFVPARMTALLMVASSYLLRLDWRSALGTFLRDGPSTPSANAGQTMACLAGALNVRLEKRGHYVLGGGADPEPRHIDAAISLVRVTCCLSLLVAALLSYLVWAVLSWAGLGWYAGWPFA